MTAAKDCIHCGHVLTPYMHWGICPVCEPSFHAAIKPPPPVDPMRDKGRPYRGGVQT